MQLVELQVGEPIEQVLARFQREGRQQKEMAELLGIERSTVSRWLKDFQISRG